MPDASPENSEPPIPIEAIVTFESRVTSGISAEVLGAFHEPPGGTEVGGILLGTASADQVLVADFEPVLCGHEAGPSFVLSDDDLEGLEESVEWFRTPQASGHEVLGFYRSQTRPESSIDERDAELIRRFFGRPGSLFLFLKPGRGEAITAELFVLADGVLRPAGHPMLFPSDPGNSGLQIPGLRSRSARAERVAGRFARPEEAVQDPEKVVDAEIPRPSLPPSRRRVEETQEVTGRNRTWVAAAAVLVLMVATAFAGYKFLSPRRSVPTPRTSATAASVPMTPATSPMPAPVRAVETTPPPAEPGHASAIAEQGIREALAQWERAIRSGDPSLIAACYAPQRNLSNDKVRRAAVQSMSRYGKPAVLRISDVTVTPVSEDRAIASFRKHWQTRGPRVFAGEEQERLTFIKAEDVWKIASEEETKVYWKRRPRG